MIYSTQELRPIFEFLHGEIGTSPDRFFEQNTIARTLWLAMRIDGEIKNGGINQLLWNFHVDFSACIFDALNQIGAPEVQALISEFTKSANKKKQLIEHNWDDIPAATLKLSHKLSDQYYGLQPSLESRIIDYANRVWSDTEFQTSIASLTFKKSDIADQIGFLVEAARGGDLKSAEALLKKLPHPNYLGPYGNSPFVEIAQAPTSKSKIAMVKLFLSYNADINMQDTHERSLLVSGIKDAALILFLIESGADIEKTNDNGRSAIFSGTISPKSTQHLIDAGADINRRNGQGISALSAALSEHKSWQDNPHAKSYQPKAAKVIQKLLDHGANFSDGMIVTYETTTELTWFVQDSKMLAYLLKQEGVKNAPEFNPNHSGWTAVFEAALVGNLKSLKLLIEAGANLNQELATVHLDSKSFSGSTPLTVATKKSVKTLLEKHDATVGGRKSYAVFMDTRGEEAKATSLISDMLGLSESAALERWQTVKKQTDVTFERVGEEYVTYAPLFLGAFGSEEEAEELRARLKTAQSDSFVV